jgi:Na+-translocating ferredoxin:NAD+ oxidoreductase RnfG subunit
VLKRKTIEWYLALFALITLFVAFWVGKSLEKNNRSQVIQKFYPSDQYTIQSINSKVYRLYNKVSEKTYTLALASGKGYAGPIELMVVFDTNNISQNIQVLYSKETPSYLKKVRKNNYIKSLENKQLTNYFRGGYSTDGVSGATKTCEGIEQAVKQSSRHLASVKKISLPSMSQDKQWDIDYKEALIVLLFLLGFLGRIKDFKYKNLTKWITLLFGIVFIGFILNQPITTTRINSLILGFWPDFHQELYFYLLFFGVFLIMITTGKNMYCGVMCPFGGIQEVLKKTGNAKNIKVNHRMFWKWMQRSFSWLAILLALVLRHPTATEYEVYSGLFQFIGSNWLFILLAIVIITSLFLSNPWCNYLCPVKPVFEYVQLFRNKAKGYIKKL